MTENHGSGCLVLAVVALVGMVAILFVLFLSVETWKAGIW